MERNNIKILFHFFSFQFYKQRTQSIATPHSVHAFPYSLSTTFNNQDQNPNRRESFDYESSRSHFRDKERDLYEQQIEFERELERERFV